MSIIPRFVGLDYHEDTIRVCVIDETGRQLVNRDCRNDVREVAACVQVHGTPKCVAIEACGGAAALAHRLQQRHQWDVRLAHPGYVNRLKQSPDKSDHDDAELLADLLRVNYLPEVWLAPPETLQLRRLVRFRQGLAADRKNVKLRIRALLREERVAKPAARPWTKAWLAWLHQHAQLGPQASWVMVRLLEQLQDLHRRIADCEKQLQAVTAADPMTQALLQRRGIGLITAVTFRAEIGRFDRFRNGKQLARFCSVTPLNASSGKRQADAGLVRQGNPELRRIVIEAAHRLSRYEPRWRDLRDRLIANGKPTSVAIAAVANRWIRWLYYQMNQPAALAA